MPYQPTQAMRNAGILLAKLQDERAKLKAENEALKLEVKQLQEKLNGK